MKHLLWAITTSFALVSAGIAHAASIAISEPAVPRSYENFIGQVTFDAPYCVSASYPLIGEGELRDNVFSVTLSHLKPGACSNTFRIAIPGLPAQSPACA